MALGYEQYLKSLLTRSERELLIFSSTALLADLGKSILANFSVENMAILRAVALSSERNFGGMALRIAAQLISMSRSQFFASE